MELLSNKINIAKERIMQAFQTHGNNIYVAYSGGKDSKVLKHLCKDLPLVYIHNSHPGETIGQVQGILVVREPKERVKEFLKEPKNCIRGYILLHSRQWTISISW